MHIPLKEDEIAYIEGENGTVALAKSNGHFFYLETEQKEIILFTEPEELMVASSFGRGEIIRRGLHCTLFQLRELEAPLIVLPKGHPASPRLKTVVSIGPSTEQNVLCGSEEFHGLEIIAKPGGAEVRGWLAEGQGAAVTVERF